MLAIVKLVHQGYLLPNVRYRTLAIAKSLPPKANAIEHQVIDRVRQTSEFTGLKQFWCYDISYLKEQLEQRKLLIKSGLALGIHHACNFVAPALFISLCLCFSIQPENPIPNGILMVLAYPILANNRTRWGDRVLEDIRKHNNSFDPIQRFALDGELALTGGRLDDLKQIYTAQKEADTGGCACGC